MIGRLPTGTKGFGLFAVTGRKRDPSPPAITTAFMVNPLNKSPLQIPGDFTSFQALTDSLRIHFTTNSLSLARAVKKVNKVFDNTRFSCYNAGDPAIQARSVGRFED